MQRRTWYPTTPKQRDQTGTSQCHNQDELTYASLHTCDISSRRASPAERRSVWSATVIRSTPSRYYSPSKAGRSSSREPGTVQEVYRTSSNDDQNSIYGFRKRVALPRSRRRLSGTSKTHPEQEGSSDIRTGCTTSSKASLQISLTHLRTSKT